MSLIEDKLVDVVWCTHTYINIVECHTLREHTIDINFWYATLWTYDPNALLYTMGLLFCYRFHAHINTLVHSKKAYRIYDPVNIT